MKTYNAGDLVEDTSGRWGLVLEAQQSLQEFGTYIMVKWNDKSVEGYDFEDGTLEEKSWMPIINHTIVVGDKK